VQPVGDFRTDSPGTPRDENDFALQRCHGRQRTRRCDCADYRTAIVPAPPPLIRGAVAND
jgi:hypothetical protein